MGIVYIDGNAIPFQPGDNVLQAALRAKIDAPHFCYHEALGAVGACRMCAMEMAGKNADESGRIIMSCMQPAVDGQRFYLNKENARHVQKSVAEYLMTRHPHDCPVCDEAGDCHLQDMTILAGQRQRRYDGSKVTYPNQELGPLVYNTTNRCITCYRCVRFYQNFALADDFGAYGSANRIVFRRATEGAFESPFAGNIIDICPTGTFTDKVFRRKYSRTWQLEKGPSICEFCSVGCHVEPGARAGTLRRIVPHHHAEINPYFICDRGRYGGHYSEAQNRPMGVKRGTEELSLAEIRAHLDDLFANPSTVKSLAILTSGLEDLASQLVLKQLAESLKVPFSSFVCPGQEARVRLALGQSLNPPSLQDIGAADVLLIVGDLTESAPMMDFAVRQAIKCGKPAFMFHQGPSILAELLKKHGEHTHLCTELTTSAAFLALQKGKDHAFADAFRVALSGAKKVVILAVADAFETLAIQALGDMARQLARQKNQAVQLGFSLPEVNSAGAALVSDAGSCADLLERVKNGEIKTLFCCGADPFGNSAAGRWYPLRTMLDSLIVLDNINTATWREADLAIATATWPERKGCTLNYEGRLQYFNRVYQRDKVVSIEPLIGQLHALEGQITQVFRDAFLREMGLTPSVLGNASDKLDLARFKVDPGADVQMRTSPSTLSVIHRRNHAESSKASHSEALQQLRLGGSARDLYLHPATAQDLTLAAGDFVTLKNEQGVPRFQVVVDPKLADNCLALTVMGQGLAGLCAGDRIARAQIVKAPVIRAFDEEKS